MNDLKAKLSQAGLTGTSKKEYVLNPAARRMMREQEVIRGNLLNGEWLRIPEITDRFLAACLIKPAGECIGEFAAQTGIPAEVFEKLLAYAVMKGLITKNTAQNAQIEGIEFINTAPAVEQKMEVEEAYNFQKCLVCITSEAEALESPLSIAEWEKVFQKLAVQCREADFFIHKAVNDNIIKLIELGKQHFAKINHHYILSPEFNPKSFLHASAGLAEPDNSQVTFHLESMPPDLNRLVLAEQLKEMTAPFREKEVGIQINLSFGAAPGLAREVYMIANHLSIPFGFEICSLTPNSQIGLNTDHLLQEWFSLLAQDLKSDLPFNKFSGGESFFGTLKLSCGAGKFAIAISNTGNVYPCPGLMRNELKIGSILQSDLGELERNAKKLLGKTCVEKRTGCENCAIAYFCGGGCVARAYAAEGKLDCKDPLCQFFMKGPGMVPWHFDLDAPLHDNIKQMFENRIWGETK